MERLSLPSEGGAGVGAFAMHGSSSFVHLVVVVTTGFTTRFLRYAVKSRLLDL